ncbi:RagB/SusD family nutrient uptake outer membrane protein [Prolixibacteraceae bacterium JC049]|nr:RagB/SusD family nutrient uptake outer membrane protein [Prolixibacteraceae bacterium JC049]
MMKNRIKTLTLLLVLVMAGFTSCDYLDIYPGDSPEVQDAFLDRQTSERYLMTCYSGIPYYGDVLALPITGCDEILYTSNDIQFTYYGTYPAPYLAGYGGQMNPSSPKMNYWQGTGGASVSLWTYIRHCNLFIDRMPLEAGGPVGIEAAERLQWIAEAKALKAFYHYYLLKCYGPIPIMDELIGTNVSMSELDIYREPVDEVVDYICETIDEALPNLVDHGEVNPIIDYGRVTKVAALAIKAKTLVWAASPLLNGNPDYDLKDKRGEQLFAREYDAQKWTKAKEALKDVIDLATEDNISLYMSDGSSIKGSEVSQETKYRLGVREAVTAHWNNEVIWAHYEDGGARGLQNWAMPRYEGVKSNSRAVGQRQAAPMHIAEQFYTANGVPIDKDIDWINNGWYAERYNYVTVSEASKKDAKAGEKTARLNLNRSHRFYSSLGFDRGYWEGLGRKEVDFKILKSIAGEVSGAVGVQSINATGYYTKKVCAVNNVFTNEADGTGFKHEPYAFPVIRLADILLMYAEALNECRNEGESADETIAILDQVRERSGILGVREAWGNHTNISDYDTQSNLRNIIRQERMNELAFEGARYWDIRRWKTAINFMNKPVQGWNVMEDERDEYYKVITRLRPTFSFRNYLMPIPESTLLRNPNLVQNPGW